MVIDWSDPLRWIQSTPLEDAAAALLRSIGLIIAYWLLVSTAGYLGARAMGWTRTAKALGVLTLPAVRRISDRLVAGSLAISTLATPMVAWPHDATAPLTTPAATVDNLMPHVPVPEPYLPHDTDPEPPAAEPPRISEPDLVIVADSTLEVVVRSGDNLWELAGRRMSAILGRPAADHEVAPYWVEVLNANKTRFRSGDPDLIYPGDVIVMPPLRD